MSMQAQYFKVGLFVLIAAFLGLAGGVFFGTRKLVPKESFLVETYTDESVQGLDQGSKVRNTGVVVGEVEEIRFVDSAYSIERRFTLQHGRLVLVRIRIFPDLIGQPDSKQALEQIPEAVGAGLRLRMKSQGITGVKYLEADYLDPERFPPFPITWEPEHPYIPMAPGVFESIVESIDQLTTQLSQADFKGLMDDVKRLVNSIDSEVQEADIPAVGEKVQALLDDIDAIVKGPELEQILADLRRTAQHANELTAKFNDRLKGDELQNTLDNVEKALADLPRIVDRLNQTLSHIDTVLIGQFEGVEDILQDIRITVSNLRELTDTAKKYPSWMIFGNPPPESKPGGN